jgi:hypothetical protein
VKGDEASFVEKTVQELKKLSQAIVTKMETIKDAIQMECQAFGKENEWSLLSKKSDEMYYTWKTYARHIQGKMKEAKERYTEVSKQKEREGRERVLWK